MLQFTKLDERRALQSRHADALCHSISLPRALSSHNFTVLFAFMQTCQAAPGRCRVLHGLNQQFRGLGPVQAVSHCRALRSVAVRQPLVKAQRQYGGQDSGSASPPQPQAPLSPPPPARKPVLRDSLQHEGAVQEVAAANARRPFDVSDSFTCSNGTPVYVKVCEKVSGKVDICSGELTLLPNSLLHHKSSNSLLAEKRRALHWARAACP